MPILPINHIDTKPNGTPRIGGMSLPVMLRMLLKSNPPTPLEEFAEDYDLTMGQIHAALSYYYDHQAEIEGYWQKAKALEAQSEAAGEWSPQLKERWEALQKSKESS